MRLSTLFVLSYSQVFVHVVDTVLLYCTDCFIAQFFNCGVTMQVMGMDSACSNREETVGVSGFTVG